MSRIILQDGPPLRPREPHARPFRRRSPRRHPAAQPRLLQPRRLRAPVARPGHPREIPGAGAHGRSLLPARGPHLPHLRAPRLEGDRPGTHGRRTARAGRHPGRRGDQVRPARRQPAAAGARELPAPGSPLCLDAVADRARTRARRAGADLDRQRRDRAPAPGGGLPIPGVGRPPPAQRPPPRLGGRAPAGRRPPRGGRTPRLPLRRAAARSGADPRRRRDCHRQPRAPAAPGGHRHRQDRGGPLPCPALRPGPRQAPLRPHRQDHPAGDGHRRARPAQQRAGLPLPAPPGQGEDVRQRPDHLP